MTDKFSTEFPYPVPIKVVGLNNEEFEIAVLTIVKQHFKTLSDNAISTRPSKDSKYLAMTINVIAESQEQLDSVYQSFTDHPLIIMAL